MYEKILVPLDGSELAEVALPYAEELAGKMGSEITLVHVCESDGCPNRHLHEYYMQKIVDDTAFCAKKHLGELVAKDVKEIRVNSTILVGDPSVQIAEYADREDVALIVMSTHGKSGLKRWALGSVANKTVRCTTRPIVLIRSREARPDVREQGALRKVLVPLDGSKESEVIVPHIKELALKLKVEVVLFRVVASCYHICSAGDLGDSQVCYSDQEMNKITVSAGEYLDGVGEALKGNGVAIERNVRVGDAAEGIIDFAEEINADLVAMSTHGRSGISRWIFGSVADKVLHAGSTPLLLVRTNSVLPDSDQ